MSAVTYTNNLNKPTVEMTSLWKHETALSFS